MTELSFSAKIGLLDGKSSIELSLWLSRPPLEPLEYASPAEVTLDPFASGRVLSWALKAKSDYVRERSHSGDRLMIGVRRRILLRNHARTSF